MTILKLWIPLILLFVTIFVSNSLTLTYVSVPTMTAMHNLTILLVAFLDFTLLRYKINGLTSFVLVCIFLSGIVYATHNFTFNGAGCLWLFMNLISMSMYQIYMKILVHSRILEDIESIGMTYCNSVLCVPVLLIVAGNIGQLTEIWSAIHFQYVFKMKSISLILLSGLLGCFFNVSAFGLSRLISPTSIMVVSNVNEFAAIVLSEICLQSTLDLTSSFGVLFVLLLSWLYSQTEKSSSKKVIIAVVIVVTLLGTILQYKHMNIRTVNIKYYDKLRPDLISENSTLPNTNATPRISIRNRTEFQLPKSCLQKNASVWDICKPKLCTLYIDQPQWNYPLQTVFEVNTNDFINSVLEVAWGFSPPSIDLYFRSGCGGIMEMKHLFESIEIFWPRFLGTIIVVLDAGDDKYLKYVLPNKPTHRYVIEFEYTPCMPGRMFNQYSYLNLDRYSTADYIVTIDSDCVFHSPVTPDLIFRQGKVILTSSRTFQKDSWSKSLEAIMGVGMYDGHYMVTQPITFARSTFSSFRRWFHKSKGKCYEDQIAELPPQYYNAFCWMCQLGTYLERGNPERSEYEKYWFQHLDNETLEPILRYSIHVTYEHHEVESCDEPQCYEQCVNEVINQGLCRAFGSSVFNTCVNYSNLSYINKVTFTYAHTEIQAASIVSKQNALKNYLHRLFNTTTIVLSRYFKKN